MAVAPSRPTLETLDAWFRDLLVEQLGVELEEITPAARFVDDLGADSLDLIEVFMVCEEALRIEIPDETAQGLQTVQDALAYLVTRMVGK